MDGSGKEDERPACAAPHRTAGLQICVLFASARPAYSAGRAPVNGALSLGTVSSIQLGLRCAASCIEESGPVCDPLVMFPCTSAYCCSGPWAPGTVLSRHWGNFSILLACLPGVRCTVPLVTLPPLECTARTCVKWCAFTATLHLSPPLPSPADEPLPLILIGAGCTLRLRNVRLVNAASLAVCLQLAPGGDVGLILLPIG